ncbi:zinc finger CCCH domain-containing protein 53-like isoform X1 [Diospyros lotus]|uniref:zinc finger CCCH domain-containing protein 53-like isoform X1 n=1 Tax=Diospyros lotus TaxID=55363 RepID=UPI00225C349C|nr:zinc finger CCCH domain-containing protein 53-like isoform X1 [Diospyros lotus]XP_052170258.1 zinc finger CCCH domain-containing protein 53-like isoform X1 [Diospyros lotus]XP_052170259.1 zinc finger CCCH domain-containing protein 53-like isoform X1 [Diospyros lotus]
MDTYEATRIVLQRIQNLDPENASKIMGLLLIQDHGEKEMIRLAFGPEALVHSVVIKARKELGLATSSPSTPSTPSSPSPFLANNGHPVSLSRQNSSSSRFLGGVTGPSLPSPLSIPSQSASWAASCFSDYNRDDLISPSSSSTSFSAVTSNGISNLASSSSMNSSASPFYGGGGADLMDEFQLQDQLSFLNDGSPTLGPKSPDLYYPHQDFASSPSGGDAMLFNSYGGAAWGGSVNGHPHRRSCSVNDISDDPSSGLGWKPCLYYARGYCKNGNSCRFLHTVLAADSSGAADAAAMVGSPGKLDMMEHCQDLLRSKSAHQQRLAAASQIMAASSFPYSSVTASKCMNLLLQQQTDNQSRAAAAAAAALMMGEDMHKLGRCGRLERNDFLMNGGPPGILNPGSRQIYLTFPADSTFREEDVSNYFSIYGPVQDVRIPYQQKRMFGFVTFVYPETVKRILAKGNPHFVCDARVLVKPYKEKGKVPDKFRKHQQQMERGEFSACGSPTGLDSREPFDLQLGARMLCNTQDMWRRKLEEQSDLQHAIELQSRRLADLELLDVKRHTHHRALSTGAAILSPTHSSPNFFSHQNLVLPLDPSSPRIKEEIGGSKHAAAAPETVVADQELNGAGAANGTGTENGTEMEKESSSTANGTDKNGKESPNQNEESDLPESLEHNLPDSPFASPKAVGDYMTTFNTAATEAATSTVAASSTNSNLITSSLLPANSTLDMASLKSCYFQVSRFSSGHGAIGM